MNPSIQEIASRIDAGMARILVGADRLTLGLTISLLARGHALIEGVPGTGKTLAVRALALLLGLEFRRIQFTPDLMPSDVVGTTVFNPQTAQFTTRTGEIRRECGRGSAGRASPCQGEGRGFESRRPLGGAGRRPREPTVRTALRYQWRAPQRGSPLAEWPSGLGKGLQSPVRGFDSRFRLSAVSMIRTAALSLLAMCLRRYPHCTNRPEPVGSDQFRGRFGASATSAREMRST